MVTPTGYFNSNAALFTMGALVATALAARREHPAPVLRGLFAALARRGLMLAFTPQSRGWLFTLPIVGLYAAPRHGRPDAMRGDRDSRRTPGS